MYDWANVVKAELDNVDESGNPKKPVSPGLYNASLTGVKCAKAKSGAFGVTLTFTIEDGPEKGRSVKEGIYLTKKDGGPIPFGPQRLKRRLLNLGLTADQITNFKFPANETQMGDFKFVLDNQVTIQVAHEEIKEGDAKGMKVARVTQVARRVPATEAAKETA